MNLKTTNIELLTRISEGDEHAFAILFDRYSSEVYQIACYFLKSKDLCKEIVSDVFVSLWKQRIKLTQIQNLEAYLFTITKNHSFNYLDKLSRMPGFTSDIPENFTSGFSNAEEMIMGQELETIMNNAINNLPEKCRIIFQLSRDANLKHSEIAEILSISENTVNVQIGNALRRLNEVFKKYMYILF